MRPIEMPLPNPMPTRNPEPAHPGLDTKIGDARKLQETTASRKVDDLSRHESRHDMAPKHEPKLNARDKVPAAPKPSDPVNPAARPSGNTSKK